MPHIIRCALTIRTHWCYFYCSIFIQSAAIDKNVRWPLMTSLWRQMTLQKSDVKNCTWVFDYGLKHHIYDSMNQKWRFWKFPRWLSMGGSKNWPDLRSQIEKIRVMPFVLNLTLIKSWKFQIGRMKTVPMVERQTFKIAPWGQVTWHDLVTWCLAI